MIINRIIPASESHSFLDIYVEQQKKYIADIYESFLPVPVFESFHLGREVFGTELLNMVGESVYSDKNVTDIFYKNQAYHVQSKKDSYEMKINMPFVSSSNELTVKKINDELVVELGSRRKNIFLPRFTNFMKLDSWNLNNDILTISLKKK